MDTLPEIDSALAVVESFTTAMESSTSLRQNILCSLSTNALAEPLSRFLDLIQGPQLQVALQDHKNICPCVYAERRNSLQQKICTLILKVAIFSHQDAFSLDTSLGSALVDRKVALELKTSACQSYSKASSSRRSASVPLFEIESTPHSTGGSSQWRERIKRDLAQNTEHQYQTIVRTMGETCQDLERRCNEVERPLREEQAISRQLHKEREASSVRIVELEAHNQEQSLFLEGIEQEKSDLAEHVTSLESERDDLSSQMENLRQEVQAATEKVKHARRCGTDTIKEMELIHAAAIAEKDEDLETQHHCQRELKTKIDSVEASAAELRAKAVTTAQEIAQLEATKWEQRSALDQAKINLDEKQAECNEQMELVDRLKADRNDLQSQVP